LRPADIAAAAAAAATAGSETVSMRIYRQFRYCQCNTIRSYSPIFWYCLQLLLLLLLLQGYYLRCFQDLQVIDHGLDLCRRHHRVKIGLADARALPHKGQQRQHEPATQQRIQVDTRL
jgi:hypothetical protein